MKILLAHNYYASNIPSGENRAFEAEGALLEAHGHSVVRFVRRSDDIIRRGWVGKVMGGLSTAYNPFAAREVRGLVAAGGFDLVHAHNTFPLISPSIFRASGAAARVVTLHNFRLLCSAAIPMRGGKPCWQCFDCQSPWPALIHGCYRGSRLATLPLAWGIWLHKLLRTWHGQVDAFIVPSAFQADLMAQAGLPRERIFVKPNFVVGDPPVLPWRERGDYVVFTGRLSPEKGLETLLQAWDAWGADAPELRVIGSGPMQARLQALAAGGRVRFLGQLAPADALRQVGGAKLLVLPSEWAETFGLVVAEAFSVGTPCAVSNMGALPSLVEEGQSGVVFEPGKPAVLLEAVRGFWNSPERLEAFGRGARARFETEYTEEANYRELMRIYRAAIAHRAGGPEPAASA